MKVNLNLAVHQGAHERYAVYWAPPVALGAIVALVYLTVTTVRTIREYRRVHRSVAECQAQQKLLRDREQVALRRLQQPQFQRILRVASYVNSLIDARQLSLLGLTAKLTRLLPSDVRLTALSLASGSEGPAVRMAIESNNQQKVIAFVQNLEESPDFSESVISSEDPGQSRGGPAPGGVVRVICTARYAGWQNPEVAGEPGARSSSDEDVSTIVSPIAVKATKAVTEGSQGKRPEVGSQKQEASSKK